VASSASGSATLAGRYASALFDLADEAKAIDTVESDLTAISHMIDESDDLKRLIASPVLARDEQSRAVDAVLKKAGASDTTRQFVGVCAQNRRLFALPAMIREFRRLASERRGEQAAEVISAKALNNDQKAALADALKKAVGSDVAVDEKVDPELLGGLIVRIGSRMVDGSLKTKLQQMRLAMKGVA
jgi:F-type H+-transporting ATPase subunit delta